MKRRFRVISERINNRVWKVFDDRGLPENLVRSSKSNPVISLFQSPCEGGVIYPPLSVLRSGQIKRQIRKVRCTLSSTIVVIPDGSVFGKEVIIERTWRFIKSKQQKWVEKRVKGRCPYNSWAAAASGATRQWYKDHTIRAHWEDINVQTETAKGRISIIIPEELRGKEAKPFLLDTTIGYSFFWLLPKQYINEGFIGFSFSIRLSPLEGDVQFIDGLSGRQEPGILSTTLFQDGSVKYEDLIWQLMRREDGPGLYVNTKQFMEWSSEICDYDYLVVL